MRHQRFFGKQGGFFGCAANANTQNTRRTPACTHMRHGFQNPIDNRIRRIEHYHFGFIFRAAAFGCTDDFHFIACHNFIMHNRRRIITAVLPLASRVKQYRRTQFVFRERISTTHALIHHFLHGHLCVPLHIHTDFQKHQSNACVLTNRTMTLRTQTAICQNLRNRVFGSRVFFLI